MTVCRPTAISLFSGIGGLDAGLAAAGFDIRACVELNPSARQVLRALHPEWPLLAHGDVCTLRAEDLLREAGLRAGNLDLLAGGPPCQPFSRARAWAGPPPGRADPRAKTLTAFFRVAAKTAPRVLLLENVPGLVTAAEEYLKTKVRELGRRVGERYSARFFDVQAADYGVPQRRRRLFLVCVRGDRPLVLPPQTHAPVADPARGLSAYRTAWDAIGHLDVEDWPPELSCRGRWAGLVPSIPEGANYLHHTARGKGVPLFGWRTKFWSFLLKLARQEPSWTLSATPGPATGPFHWRNRRLSVAEMAALQTIPLKTFPNVSLVVARQLFGNAVPSALGEMIGLAIRRQVLGDALTPSSLTLVPEPRLGTVPSLGVSAVPSKYLIHRGEWPEHPGPGRGPGAKKTAKQRTSASR